MFSLIKSLDLPGDNLKFSKHTTNKDHYKSWNTRPAGIIPEYPEFTSKNLKFKHS